MEKILKIIKRGGWKCVWRVEFFFKTNKRDSTFIREMRVQRQNIAGHCQQTFEDKKFVDLTQQCFALLHQVNFPANNLNFH